MNCEALPSLVRAAGYDDDRIMIDPSVVRGLEYYTGPVYEVELTFPIEGEDGKPVRFGSVGGGGRYDGLVSRFRGEPVPATGFSIGVSRLQAALQHLGKLDTKPEPGPVVVTVFDRDRIAEYQRMVAKLRDAESAGQNPRRALSRQSEEVRRADEIRRQARRALRRHPGRRREGQGRSPDQGPHPRRRDRGMSKDRDDYLKKQAEAQFAVKESELVEAVRKVLARNNVKWGSTPVPQFSPATLMTCASTQVSREG